MVIDPGKFRQNATNDPSTASSAAATPAEADELRRFVSAILAGDSEADRSEALAVALADPEAALTCYRALAADTYRPYSVVS